MTSCLHPCTRKPIVRGGLLVKGVSFLPALQIYYLIWLSPTENGRKNVRCAPLPFPEIEASTLKLNGKQCNTDPLELRYFSIVLGACRYKMIHVKIVVFFYFKSFNNLILSLCIILYRFVDPNLFNFFTSFLS